ncbi:MAG: hypothetical protein AAGC93_13420 [Cyanobacteria bacterium P01_F01_bin.53]
MTIVTVSFHTDGTGIGGRYKKAHVTIDVGHNVIPLETDFPVS